MLGEFSIRNRPGTGEYGIAAMCSAAQAHGGRRSGGRHASDQISARRASAVAGRGTSPTASVSDGKPQEALEDVFARWHFCCTLMNSPSSGDVVLLPENHRVEVGDWFAIGSIFTPATIHHEGNFITGVRQLLSIDVASQYIMDFVPLLRSPDPATAGDILHFLARVLTKEGMPRQGVIVLKSTYLSSSSLLEDPQTKEQGLFLRENGFTFPAMPSTDRSILQERMDVLKLKIGFQGLDQIEARVAMAHRKTATHLPGNDPCNN